MILRKFLAVVVALLTITLAGGILYNNVTAKSTNEKLRFDKVDAVHDGDTVYVTFNNLPEVFGKHIGVRLYGIDTPEMHDKDACLRDMAVAARNVLSQFLSRGKVLELVNVKRDKYFRLNADILADGVSASEFMLKSGRAHEYSGQVVKEKWECNTSMR